MYENTHIQCISLPVAYAESYSQYNFTCDGSEDYPKEYINCTMENTFKPLITHGDL